MLLHCLCYFSFVIVTLPDAYDWIGEVVHAFLVADKGGVDGVHNERRPAHDEHDDHEDERHGDVSLLFVDFVFVDRWTVTQVAPVSSNLTKNATYSMHERMRWLNDNFAGTQVLWENVEAQPLRWEPPTDNLLL